MRIIKYLIKYWQGKIPLTITLWLVFIGSIILISLLEPLLLAKLFTQAESRKTATIISLFFTRLILFPWLLIGLFRATEHDYIRHGHFAKTKSIQMLMLLSVIFTFTYTVENIQAVNAYKLQQNKLAKEVDVKKYTLTILENGTQLSIKGNIDFDISKEVKKRLKQQPNIHSVLLESQGGQIYEGRALSQLFTSRKLDTYILKECNSACATAFIGGHRRYMGKLAKIGFHQYKQDLIRYPKAVPYHNLQDEQQRDIELFRLQGLQQSFLDKVFNQPASEIWFPDYVELLSAGVIDSVVDK